MITAVDSNVVIDILLADERFGQASRRALSDAQQRGSTIACEVVWAEVSAGFPSGDSAAFALDRLGIAYRPLD